MSIPDGWQLVPKEPTSSMLRAYQRAISNYIEALPEDERAKAKSHPRGYRIKVNAKIRARYAAMLAAVPAIPASNQTVKP